MPVLLGTCRCSATGTITEEDHPNRDGQTGNLMTVPGDNQLAVPGENP
jgi:hypothetical protein